MNVIDKKECRKAEIMDQEIEAMQNLVDRRWMWLNVPQNKLRRTYTAVLADTREIEAKLKQLQEEGAAIKVEETY